MTDLPTVWFTLTAVIFAIYFFLDGFDFGVGLLQPFLARSEAERRAMIRTVGPFWAANEVWVILAAGVIFAAFPTWYGTLMTALYPAFALILLALIGRGVAFEYRAEVNHRRWRTFWDVTSFITNLLPAFLWGLIMANMVRGLPVGDGGRFDGSILYAFNTFSVLGGLATLSLFVLHGATYLLLRLEKDSELHRRARRAALTWGAAASALVLAFVYQGFIRTGLFGTFGLERWLFPAAAAGNLALIWLALTVKRDALAFAATGLTIVFSTGTIFGSLYPNVQPSTLGEAFNLTVRNAASEPYTLRLLTWVSATFLPLIIGYQVWNFYVFRQRIRAQDERIPGGQSDGVRPGDTGQSGPY